MSRFDTSEPGDKPEPINLNTDPEFIKSLDELVDLITPIVRGMARGLHPDHMAVLLKEGLLFEPPQGKNGTMHIDSFRRSVTRIGIATILRNVDKQIREEEKNDL